MKKLTKVIVLTWDLVLGHLTRYFPLFLVGLLVGVLIVIVVPKLTSVVKPIQRNVQTVGLTGNYTLATLPLEIQEKISFGLTRLSPDGRVLPGIAKSFESTDSGKTIVFHLDNSLKWQDGTAIEPNSINYRLKGVEVKKTNETIEFDLKEPFAPLPVLLSRPIFRTGNYKNISILPKFVNDMLFKSSLIGVGDYRATNIKYKGRFISDLTLEKISDGTIIEYKFYTNFPSSLVALKLGNVSSLKSLYSDPNLDVNYYTLDQTFAPDKQAVLFFNNNDQMFQDKKARQAIAYAIPNEFVQGKKSNGPLGYNNWARSANVKKYEYDTETAKDLFKPFATKSGELKINMFVDPLLVPTANEIKKSLSSLGISLQIDTFDSIDFPPSNYQTYLDIVELPEDPDQYAFWHSTQRTNISNYHSPKVDRLLEEARRTYDEKTRMQKYSDFQKAITEDLPAIFLFYPYEYSVTRK